MEKKGRHENQRNNPLKRVKRRKERKEKKPRSLCFPHRWYPTFYVSSFFTWFLLLPPFWASRARTKGYLVFLRRIASIHSIFLCVCGLGSAGLEVPTDGGSAAVQKIEGPGWQHGVMNKLHVGIGKAAKTSVWKISGK